MKKTKAGMWILVLIVMVLLSSFVSAKSIVGVSNILCASRLYAFYDDGTYSSGDIPADLASTPIIDLTQFSGGYSIPSGEKYSDIVGVASYCGIDVGLTHVIFSNGNNYGGDIGTFPNALGDVGLFGTSADANIMLGLVYDTRFPGTGLGSPKGINYYSYYDYPLGNVLFNLNAKYDLADALTATYDNIAMKFRTGRNTDQIVGTVFVPKAPTEPDMYANDGTFFIFFNDGTYSYASTTTSNGHELPGSIDGNPYISQAGAPAVEDCSNGIDDDGDGFIDCADTDCSADAACPCGLTSKVDIFGPNLHQGDVYDPHSFSFAWNGNGYGVVWTRSDKFTYFTSIDSQGNRNMDLNNDGNIDSNDNLLISSTAWHPSIAWSPVRNEYAIVYTYDGRNTVSFVTLSSNGILDPNPRELSGGTGGLYPSITWNNNLNKFGFVWSDRDNAGVYDLYFADDTATSSLDARIVGGGVRNGAVGFSYSSIVAASNSDYIASFHSEQDRNWISIFNTGGAMASITSAFAYPSNAVYTGNQNYYAVANQDSAGVNLDRMWGNGNILSTTTVTSSQASPALKDSSIVWNPNDNEYGIAWIDNRNLGTGVYFTKADANGNQIDLNNDGTVDQNDEIKVSSGTAWSSVVLGLNPVDNRYDILWDSGKLSFTSLDCQPPPATCTDSDFDGFSLEGGACGATDCDDTNPNIYPGAPEICDGLDNDCNPATPFDTNCAGFANVFVTTGPITFFEYGISGGNLGGLAGADNVCMQEASKNQFFAGKTFRAWLSDSTADARDRITHSSIPYKLADGTLVADDWNDLVTADANGNYLKNPINKDAQGGLPQNPQTVWTGTNPQGQWTKSRYADCNGWTSSAIADRGQTGTFNIVDDRWTLWGAGNCFGTSAHLYCFEQLSSDYCGNNIIEGTELCDGTALAGETCATQGLVSGTLSCLADCSGFDLSGCSMSPQCSNSLDDDGDGLIDTEDPGCYDSGAYNLNDNDETDTLPQCSDFFDNDNNGCADYLTDSGCALGTDTTETGGTCPVELSDESSVDFTICHGPDTDGDGICDKYDNCPLKQNFNQIDADSSCVPKKSDPAYWGGNNLGWLQNPQCGDACELGCLDVVDDLTLGSPGAYQLCAQEYGIVDANVDGVIKITSDGVNLDCNGATIRNNLQCNLKGDANYNGKYDYEDVYLIYNTYWKIFNGATTGFDYCQDFNSDGVIDQADYETVASLVDCTGAVKGDYDGSGIIDNYDIFIYAKGALNVNIDPACGDLTGDGTVDGSDMIAMGNEIASSLAVDHVNKICTRYGAAYPMGDLDYNGVLNNNDLLLLRAMTLLNFPPDLCGDFDSDGIISGVDFIEISQEIINNPPPCTITGDVNYNNKIEGGDLFLLQEMIDGTLTGYKDIACGNVYTSDDYNIVCEKIECSDGLDNDGDGLIDMADPDCIDSSDMHENTAGTSSEPKQRTNGPDCSTPCPPGYAQFRCNYLPKLNQNDIDALLSTLAIGYGISIEGANNIEIKNCNIYDYAEGIRALDSSNNLFHDNQFYNLFYDINFQGASSGTGLYLNHLYSRGVNDAGANNYCVDPGAGFVGNYYGQDIGDIITNDIGTIAGQARPANMGQDDCGPVIINLPDPAVTVVQNSITIEFNLQASKNYPLKYYVDYLGQIYPEGVSPYWQAITEINGDQNTPAYSYDWDITAIPDQDIDIRITPFDGLYNATPTIVHVHIDRTGGSSGTVECCEDKADPSTCDFVEGASVCYKDAPCAVTDANGAYTIDDGIPMGPQTLIASKPKMKSQRTDADIIPLSVVSDVNFNDVCPITIDCNPDCTVVGTETETYPVCDPRCDGVDGCSLNPQCEYASKGSVVRYEDADLNPVKVTCCTGAEEPDTGSEEESKLEVDAENIARTTRIVDYNGKLIKMVVVTWD